MLGIATYGYKIIRVIGVRMVHLTFARGFAVELGAAIVIVVASRYGLPVSSTQVCLHCLSFDKCRQLLSIDNATKVSVS